MPMVHEFGIMLVDPQPGERYDAYEPKKYGCITVNDDLVEVFAPKLAEMPCYWHTLERPEKGLAYCGITLIPPGSLAVFSKAVSKNKPLQTLIEKAVAEKRFIIHFGL